MFLSAAENSGTPFSNRHNIHMDMFTVPFYNLILVAKTPLAKAFPEKLETVGDHVRTARLRRGLEQGQLASILGVTESTVWNWESNRSSPPIHQCARVLEFLGYDPFPEPSTFAEKLVSFRRLNGLRVRDAASLAEVDPASWSSWERGEHQITARYLDLILALLSDSSDSPVSALERDPPSLT
jgi:transcriptional regulator with XRE-family HTH domain